VYCTLKGKRTCVLLDHVVFCFQDVVTHYKLDEIVEGGLEQVIEPLINDYQADQRVALSE